MNDFILDLGISAILTTLKTAIKNPKSKAKYEKVMRKVYYSILMAYPEFANGDDEE